MRLSIQNILIATPIQGLFMVFLYRVFPEVWISFSDKISKTNPSTRLVSLNMGRNSEMGEVSLRQGLDTSWY